MTQSLSLTPITITGIEVTQNKNGKNLSIDILNMEIIDNIFFL